MSVGLEKKYPRMAAQCAFVRSFCGDLVMHQPELDCVREARRAADDIFGCFSVPKSYSFGPRHQVDHVAAKVPEARAHHLLGGSVLTYPREAVDAVRQSWNAYHEHKKTT